MNDNYLNLHILNYQLTTNCSQLVTNCSQLVTNCHALKMIAPDGKMRLTDASEAD